MDTEHDEVFASPSFPENEKTERLIEDFERFIEMKRSGESHETLRSFVTHCENLEYLAQACDAMRRRSGSVEKVQEISRHLSSAAQLWKPGTIIGVDIVVGQRLFELLTHLTSEVEKKTARAARIRVDELEIPILSMIWDSAPILDKDWNLQDASRAPKPIRREVICEEGTSTPKVASTSTTILPAEETPRAQTLETPTPLEVSLPKDDLVRTRAWHAGVDAPLPKSPEEVGLEPALQPTQESLSPILPDFDALMQQTWTTALRSCTLQSWRFNCVAHGNLGHPTSGASLGKGMSVFWGDEKDPQHTARLNLTHNLSLSHMHEVRLSVWVLRSGVIEQSAELLVPHDKVEQALVEPVALIEKLK